MKEILDTKISVRVMGDNKLSTKTVREVILEPEGIHLDDMIYAMQLVIAGIIRQEESK